MTGISTANELLLDGDRALFVGRERDGSRFSWFSLEESREERLGLGGGLPPYQLHELSVSETPTKVMLAQIEPGHW
jgi:hypothetical protein